MTYKGQQKMSTPEIKYFGHAVYSGIRGLSRSKEDWSKLWTLARKIESDIKEIDQIYSENFLLIEESQRKISQSYKRRISK